MTHFILATNRLLGKYVDRKHRIRVGNLDRKVIGFDELGLRMMIRDGRKDRCIIGLRGISVRVGTVDGMKVRLKLGNRGQEVWLGARHTDVTLRRFRSYGRIVAVETLRIANRRARARYCRGFSMLRLNRRGSGNRNGLMHVVLVNMAAFSIALLVGSSLHTSSSLLSLRIDAIIRDAIFNAAKTRTGIVTFLACLLAAGAGILDLATLCTDKRLLLGWREAVNERIDMHRHL